MNAKGNRRRAHEYKRWALEAEQAGHLSTYRFFREQANKSWRGAWDALGNARFWKGVAP